jgi:hypothetical protein
MDKNMTSARPFFEQFDELNKKVPTPNIAVTQNENSDYSNYNLANKNCYLCFAGNYLEDSLYCYNVQESKNCYDSLFLHNCELCYECIQSQDCYNTIFALHAKNCNECSFIEDCQSCSNCFMCCNLRNKEYYAFNKKVNQEEYKKLIADYKLEMPEGLEKAKSDWAKFRLTQPKRENHNIQCENCSGEYIVQSKNCHDCYLMDKGGEDCKYILNAFPDFKDSTDCSYSGEKAELHYETMASGFNTSQIFFTNLGITGSNKLYYCNFVASSKDCFGCCSLRKKQYCILNKQYSKEEYEKLLAKIIEHMKSSGEWGEFFPSEISPYPYNISTASAFLPLSKEEVEKRGLKWREHEEQNTTQAQDTQICAISGKIFKIIPEEIAVYKRFHLPLPELCFEQRHLQRMAQLNPYKSYKRTCAKSGKEIFTTYSPERPEIVYCIDEYRKIIQ